VAALGAFLADAVIHPLPPAFDPWFESRCPDVRPQAARAVLELLAGGATVPFILRYRKERTGNLAEGAVRRILEAAELFEKILSRQTIICESIDRHARLTPDLRERIFATFDMDGLEDLYHPYRQQKKNRALAAREAGLEPLADWIWSCGHGTETPHEGQTLELWAFTFRDEQKGVADARAAIEGARDILVERMAGDPELRARVRRAYFEDGWLRSTKTDNAKTPGRFEAYFAFQERVASLREPLASHRYLALRRGQSEGELQIALGGPPDDAEFEARLVAAFESAACTVADSPGAEVLRHAGRIAFKNDVRTSIENEVHRVLKDAADVASARALAVSVRRLLLEAPFGRRPVLALDPGVRTGGRLAVLDAVGAFVVKDTVSLQTEDERAAARETVVRLAREHGVCAVGVGSGPGGRGAEVAVRAALREAALEVPVVLVSEAGPDAWGASEAARQELPDLEPQVRSAVSLGRRLQDPLAELLRIEPRNLGASLHQHEVPHAVLQRALDAVVEGCVSEVGVDLNAAPCALLARVSGLGPGLAAAIVAHRTQAGPFKSRRQLLDVAGLGPQAFEQAAGFLRVRGGEHPLDDTAVHPERYAALEAFAASAARGVAELLGQGAALVREATALKEELGAFTWEDIVAELERPGHDPRGPFVPFAFREDALSLQDLKPGMRCPGIVTNVTTFGAFVDIGVHHDGLVHVSQLASSPGRDAKEAIHPGDRLEVRVLKVDLEKRQISLTTREPPARRPPPSRRPPRPRARAIAPQKARQAKGSTPPGPDTTLPVVAPSSADNRPRPKPERPRAARLEPRPAERRPEPRRPAFNNPFAVLASLKTPPKRDKS
jgi:protein Tex